MKKFLMILAAALTFAACEETQEVILPEPVLGDVTASIKDNNVTISCPISEFTYVNANETPVGIWISNKADLEKKNELPATFNAESSVIEGGFNNVEYGAYVVGALVFVDGNKYYSKGVDVNNALKPVFGKVSVKVDDQKVTVSGTVADFKIVNEKSTVGVWFSTSKDGKKTEVAGNFNAEKGLIEGVAEVPAYEKYLFGTYVNVNGLKCFSEGVEADIVLPKLTYGGVTYNTVLLSNGQVWMAENLRYVPKGMSVSDDPNSGNGVWYPSTPGKGASEKDEAKIKEMGYLYDHYVALGIDKAKVAAMVKDNKTDDLTNYLKTFEGAQGICPEGWHVPTVQEIVDMVGKGILAIKDNEKAPFWDKDKKYGSMTIANKAGFNCQFPGQVFVSGFGKVGKYNSLVISGSAAEFNGHNKMNYIAGSTLYKVNTASAEPHAITNCQFYGIMGNFASNYLQIGGMAATYNAIASGSAVRCIRNAK